MSDSIESMWEEIKKAARLDDNHIITGAVIMVRSTNMETGQMTVHMGSTDDTDYIVQLGLLHEGLRVLAIQDDD